MEDWSWVMEEENCVGRKEMKSWVSSAQRWWLILVDERMELSGDVYSEKSRGPKTDP